MQAISGNSRRISWLLIVVLLVILFSVSANSRERIAVGGYLFPPFVNDPLSESPGITFSLIKALNREQDQFEFYFVPTGPNRRYHSFVTREFDVILFESPNWGWKQRGLQFGTTAPFHFGGEVYVTRRQKGRGQDWFDSIESRSICGIFGYHYGFADFVSNSVELERKYDIFLSDRPKICLNMVLHDRAELSVVTRSWLTKELTRSPGLAEQILVSDRMDQEYRHQAIIHPDSPLPVDALNSWLQALRKRGDIEKMLTNSGRQE